VEPGSPFRHEIQVGQVTLHRTIQGLMPPVKSRLDGFTHLSRIILAKNPDGSMPAHTKGCEGNLLLKTQIRSLRMSGPLDGAPDALTTGSPCVTSSLALVALGGSDPSSGVHLQTLCF
jgi:hypothetical protein